VLKTKEELEEEQRKLNERIEQDMLNVEYENQLK
jgi:hypothetical protein